MASMAGSLRRLEYAARAAAYTAIRRTLAPTDMRTARSTVMTISVVDEESLVSTASSNGTVIASPIPNSTENGSAAFLKKRNVAYPMAFKLSNYTDTMGINTARQVHLPGRG